MKLIFSLCRYVASVNLASENIEKTDKREHNRKFQMTVRSARFL